MRVLLKVREAAPLFRMSEQALYRAIREEQLPKAAVIRIGTRIRIDPAALWMSPPQETLSKEEDGARESGDNNERL
jgi:hypothetical protein